MKIRLLQQILLKDQPRTFREIYKDYESDFVPRKGDYIYDSAFKDPYECEVVSVTIDYEHDMCYVYLHYVELETNNEDAIIKYIEKTKLHGWKCDTL